MHPAVTRHRRGSTIRSDAAAVAAASALLAAGPRRRSSRVRWRPMGAGNSAVVVDLPRMGPMLSPREPHHVPIPGPRMERETPGQRPRPNYGHPHPQLPASGTVPLRIT